MRPARRFRAARYHTTMIILCLTLMFAPAVRAEESFEQNAETIIRSDWRKELLQRLSRENPPLISTGTGLDLDRVSLRFSLEDRDGRWKDLATMTMTRRTFDRYRDIQRRWEDDAVLRRRNDEDPRRYFGSLGQRGAAAAADVLFTSLARDPYVQAHPWLDEPVSFLVETMRLLERFDRGSVWDVFGFELNDFVSDRFGLGRDRARSLAPGTIAGSPDGEFHGRLRIGVSGVERAATRIDGDPLKFKAKYEIECPRSFVLDSVEIGGEARPFCRDDRDMFRVYIGGGKSF